MTNNITYRPLGLITAADKAAAGAATYAVAIPVHHNGAAKILADRNSLFTANSNLEQARVTLGELRSALGVAVKEGKVFLTLGRDILKPQLGRKHSQAWAPTGFVQSFRMHQKAEDLALGLETFAEFLEDHPGLAQGPLGITQAAAEALLAMLSAAITAVAAQKSAVKTLSKARDTAVANMRKTLIDLKGEVGALINGSDARWLEYGFNLPDAPMRPEAPANLSVMLFGPSALAVKWDAAPRANYYRLWLKVIGVDVDFGTVGNTTDLDFILQTLPSNSSVEVKVSAMNEAGESEFSNVVTFAVQ